ncbi:protein phosphatase 2C domain-containing protein, partial [Myxococcota bacterium]|nr:protein phosphatase 2C domain-containing protein [Myxococcota bacterium]
MRLYTVTSGTVTGREHVRLGRNNQDAIGLAVGEGHVVAVVADGCSSARSSEVGARLAAAWIAAHAPEHFGRAPEGEDAALDEAVGDGGRAARASRDVARLFDGLLRFLGDTARALSMSGEIEPAIVGEHLLFTVLGAWIDDVRVVVFGQGDGVFAVNGRVTRLENAGAPDAPRYPGYALVDARALEGGVSRGGPVVHFTGDASALVSLALATDGV